MNIMKRPIPHALCGILLVSLAACSGGGGSGSSMTATPQSGTVPLVVSDASSEDWSIIGVKILGIALQPQGGGTPVTVYSSSSAPLVNLAQLDQIGEILGNVSIPVGTYTGAILTVGGNPGDVMLTAAADPESGFAGTAGATVDSSQIQIQHTKGAAPSKTVDVSVTFESPLVVTTSQNNALDLEFDLDHPAFIVDHVPPSGGGATVWAVNFEGPVRHHPIRDLASLVLRHTYGTVTAVASDNASITITKVVPTLPVVNPETSVATSQSLKISVDATNGTWFYDVDAKTSTVIKSFATEAAVLNGKYVRVAARYQQDGSLIATRIWASSQFNSVWLSPEGHVLHVDTTNNVIRVTNESAGVVALTVDAGTQFFFRGNDTTPIGTGTAFLANVKRGFKIHASVRDPLATPLVADLIEIETAAFDGRISNANAVGFTYTRQFATVSDNYTATLDYISPTTPNGKDASGNAIAGFKWWDFAYPTVVTSGSTAIADFEAATSGSVNFGGTFGSVPAYGVSYATWGDSANPTGWSAPWTILTPARLPLGLVATGLANNAFTMTILRGTQPATIDVGTAKGAATLVYQVDRTGGVVTISSVDVSTSAGLTTLSNGLVVGAPVKVYGVPQSDGTFRAYVLTYFTGATQTTM